MPSTAKRIEEMSDGVEFERLALAVLRRMMPDCHAVIHESANADGKPIASKVDAFATVSGSHPARCVVVACTTEKRKGIKAKWLFDHQNPEGEYVGTHFFGTPVKHASLDLLKQIGGSSLEQRQARPDFKTATKRVPRAGARCWSAGASIVYQ